MHFSKHTARTQGQVPMAKETMKENRPQSREGRHETASSRRVSAPIDSERGSGASGRRPTNGGTALPPGAMIYTDPAFDSPTCYELSTFGYKNFNN